MIRSWIWIFAAVIVSFLVPAESAEAQTWQPGKGLRCGSPANPGQCLASGPGCQPSTPAGQCAFPKAQAVALCRAHPQCQGVTCFGRLCFARQNANFVPDRGATSIAVPKGRSHSGQAAPRFNSPPPVTRQPTSPRPPVFSPPAPSQTSPSRRGRSPARVSRALRDYLFDLASRVRSGLPTSIGPQLDVLSAATCCSTGCDVVGGAGLMMTIQVTDFDSVTMPAAGYRSRVAELQQTSCADAHQRADLFGWGLDATLEFVDRNNRSIEKVTLNSASCGLPMPQPPARDQAMAIGNKRGCLDVEGKSRAPGALIVSAPCDGTPSQNFQFRFVDQTATGQDIWMLVNAASRLCMTVTGGSADAGTTIQQAPCSGATGDATQWFRWLDQSAPFNQVATTASMHLDVTHGPNFRSAVTQQHPSMAIEQFFVARPAGMQGAGGTPTFPGPTPTPSPSPNPPPHGSPAVGIPAHGVKPPAGVLSVAEQQRLDQAMAAADLTAQERLAQVAEEVRDIRADLADADLTYLRQVAGGLDTGDEATVSLGTLSFGQRYEVIGLCDQGCLDLDFDLVDSGGDSVGSDTQLDAAPFVEVKPTKTQTYQLKVSMPNCQVDPCRWGAVVGREVLQDAGGKAAKKQEVETEAKDATDDFDTADFRRLTSRDGSQVEGGTKTFEFNFRSNQNYVVFGVCDDSCSDLGLEMTDGRGRLVDSDDGSFPEVEVSTSSAETFQAHVTMHACSDEPCQFKLVVMQEIP